MIKTSELPGTIYQAHCKACGALSTYTQFEASFFDFVTYFGETTGTLYRLNIDRTDLKYGKISVEDALKPAVEHEGGRTKLRLVPDELRCPKCRQTSILRARELGNGHEESVKGVELPSRDQNNG
jgi:hypothetical protein